MNLGELNELSNEELKRLEKRPIPERPEPDGTWLGEGATGLTLTGKVISTAALLFIPLLVYGVAHYPVQVGGLLVVGVFILALFAIWRS